MKMRIYVLALLAVLAAASAEALTINDAVSLALKNNHSLKQVEYAKDSAMAGVDVARSAFMPGAAVEYNYARSSEKAYGTDDDFSSLSLSLGYNIYSGNADSSALDGARADADASTYQYRIQKAGLVLTAKQRYFEVLRAAKQLMTVQEGVELLKRQRHDAALYYREGLIAKNDLLKVDVELSSAEQDLLQARGNLRIALRKLENTIGIEVASEAELQDIEVTPAVESLAFEPLRAELLKSRSEMAYYRMKLKSLGYGIESIESGYKPTVDLGVSYNVYGDSPLPAGRDYSYDSEAKAGLTAKWTLYDGSTKKYSVMQARAARQAVEEEFLDVQNSLVLQLNETLEGYEISKGKLNVAEVAIDQAEENYRVTDSQFRERVATTTDLINARSALTRARLQFYQALYDLHISAATLDRVLER